MRLKHLLKRLYKRIEGYRLVFRYGCAFLPKDAKEIEKLLKKKLCD